MSLSGPEFISCEYVTQNNSGIVNHISCLVWIALQIDNTLSQQGTVTRWIIVFLFFSEYQMSSLLSKMIFFLFFLFLYVRIVTLEAAFTFPFLSTPWKSDVQMIICDIANTEEAGGSRLWRKLQRRRGDVTHGRGEWVRGGNSWFMAETTWGVVTVQYFPILGRIWAFWRIWT